MIAEYFLDRLGTINLGTVKVGKDSLIVAYMTKDGKIGVDILLHYINDTPIWIGLV